MSECILELDDTSINQLDVLLKKDEKGKEKKTTRELAGLNCLSK